MTFDSAFTTPRANGAMSPRLGALLVAAFDAEARMTGSGRRRQFRITRRLLTAMRTLIPMTEIAEFLGRSPDTIRDRATDEGALSANDFSTLSGVPANRIINWEHVGHLPPPVIERDGYVGYPPVALLKAYIETSQTPTDMPGRNTTTDRFHENSDFLEAASIARHHRDVSSHQIQLS